MSEIKRKLVIEGDSSGADKALKDMAQSQTEVTMAIKETNSAQEEFSMKTVESTGIIGVFDKATGGMITTMRSASTTIGVVSKSLVTLRGALIATGIGAIVVVLGSLIAYLTSTQEGIDKVSSVLTPLKVVFQALIGVLQEVGKFLFNAFTQPKKTIEDLYNFMKDRIIKQFTAYGKILEGIVTFNWSKIKEGAGDLADAVVNDIRKVSNAAKGFGDRMVEAFERGKEIDRLQKQIEGKELDIIELRAETNRQLKEQQLIARDTSKSNAERLAAVEEQTRLTKLIKEEERAILLLQIQQLELKQKSNDSSREDLRTLAQLKAQLIDIDNAITDVEISNLRVINSIRREGEAEAKKRRDEEIAHRKKLAEAHKEMLDKIEELENEYLQGKLTDQQKELNAVQDKYFKLIQYAIEYNQDIKILETAQQEEIDAINKKYADRRIKLDQDLFDIQSDFTLKRLEKLGVDVAEERLRIEEEAALANIDKLVELGVMNEDKIQAARQAVIDFYTNQLFELRIKNFQEGLKAELEQEEGGFQARLELLDRQRQLILENELLTETERTKLLKENSDARIAIQEAEFNARMLQLTLMSNAFKDFSTILGKETAAGKAAAVAASTIATIQSAISSYNSLSGIPIYGPVLGVAAAAAALKSGYDNVKKILSVKVPGGDAPGGTIPVANVARPNFNIVGTSETNQLAQTIGSVNDEPIKAFVVSNEISSQQELDRNRINSATFL